MSEEKAGAGGPIYITDAFKGIRSLNTNDDMFNSFGIEAEQLIIDNRIANLNQYISVLKQINEHSILDYDNVIMNMDILITAINTLIKTLQRIKVNNDTDSKYSDTIDSFISRLSSIVPTLKRWNENNIEKEKEKEKELASRRRAKLASKSAASAAASADSASISKMIPEATALITALQRETAALRAANAELIAENTALKAENDALRAENDALKELKRGKGKSKRKNGKKGRRSRKRY